MPPRPVHGCRPVALCRPVSPLCTFTCVPSRCAFALCLHTLPSRFAATPPHARTRGEAADRPLVLYVGASLEQQADGLEAASAIRPTGVLPVQRYVQRRGPVLSTAPKT